LIILDKRLPNGIVHGTFCAFISAIVSLVIGVCESQKYLGANAESPLRKVKMTTGIYLSSETIYNRLDSE